MWCPGIKLYDIEKEVILKALRFYQGNKTKTAESLGIAARTLYNKLEEYGYGKSGDGEEGNRPSEQSANSQRGSDMEPASKVSEKREVPVLSERQEVQEVLPKQDAKGNSKTSKGR